MLDARLELPDSLDSCLLSTTDARALYLPQIAQLTERVTRLCRKFKRKLATLSNLADMSTGNVHCGRQFVGLTGCRPEVLSAHRLARSLAVWRLALRHIEVSRDAPSRRLNGRLETGPERSIGDPASSNGGFEFVQKQKFAGFSPQLWAVDFLVRAGGSPINRAISQRWHSY